MPLRGDNTRRGVAGLGRMLALGCAFAISPLAAAAADASVCAGPILATHEAIGARDGATIRLATGEEVRLAGVIAPDEFDGETESARRATDALDSLVAGRRILLHGRKPEQDRYGRHVAHVTIGGGAPQWAQRAMVGAGLLRVAPGLGSGDCSAILLQQENAARGARAGLWAGDEHRVRSAADTGTLLREAGRFALVEGTVRRIGEAGGRLFLDFGRRYNEDFTVIVPREAQAEFAKAGLDLRSLAERRVRARGVLFAWGGPAMELDEPAALEVIGAGER